MSSMKFQRTVRLKDGRTCILRNGVYADGAAALDVFLRTHEQTDYLLSYPDEITFTAEEEGQYLQEKTESANEIELVAEVDGEIVGLGGIEAVGKNEKVRHRAEFGVSVLREFWNNGIGHALLDSCIECAKKAGYAQLELTVVSENAAALALYLKAGFTECGRNPKGFCSRLTGDQETVQLRLEL